MRRNGVRKLSKIRDCEAIRGDEVSKPDDDDGVVAMNQSHGEMPPKIKVALRRDSLSLICRRLTGAYGVRRLVERHVCFHADRDLLKSVRTGESAEQNVQVQWRAEVA